MKYKFIALMALIAVSLSSCSVSDDDVLQSFALEVVAITDVEIPDPFIFGETNEIIVRYNNPSSCHRFAGFDVRSNLNEREVTVVTEIFDRSSCEEENIPTEQVLRFLPTSNGTIIFRFFTGLNDEGEREFIEIEVDVQE